MRSQATHSATVTPRQPGPSPGPIAIAGNASKTRRHGTNNTKNPPPPHPALPNEVPRQVRRHRARATMGVRGHTKPAVSSRPPAPGCGCAAPRSRKPAPACRLHRHAPPRDPAVPTRRSHRSAATGEHRSGGPTEQPRDRLHDKMRRRIAFPVGEDLAGFGECHCIDHRIGIAAAGGEGAVEGGELLAGSRRPDSPPAVLPPSAALRRHSGWRARQFAERRRPLR